MDAVRLMVGADDMVGEVGSSSSSSNTLEASSSTKAALASVGH